MESEPHKISEPKSALEQYREGQNRDNQLNEAKKALKEIYGYMSEYSAFTQKAMEDFQTEHPEIDIESLIEGIK